MNCEDLEISSLSTGTVVIDRRGSQTKGVTLLQLFEFDRLFSSETNLSAFLTHIKGSVQESSQCLKSLALR